jgi:dTDP-4-dehydrorhamnose 3,5-epimerase
MITIEETELPGVKLIKPKIHYDVRGSFQESYNLNSFRNCGIETIFTQDNYSISSSINTIRGLHFQSDPFSQTKLIRVLKGSILDVIVDTNPSSPNFMKHICFTLDDKLFYQLYIPKGYAHGFRTLENDTHVLYKVDNYYSPQHAFGIKWNDPELKINWGCDMPILSEQDLKLPSLKEYLGK